MGAERRFLDLQTADGTRNAHGFIQVAHGPDQARGPLLHTGGGQAEQGRDLDSARPRSKLLADDVGQHDRVGQSMGNVE